MKYLLALSVLFCFELQAQTPAFLLKEAWKHQDESYMLAFFYQWKENTAPFDKHYYDSLNDTLKDAYAVFEAFYQPTNLEILGDGEWGAGLYDSAHFLIVQNSLELGFCKSVYRSRQELLDSAITIMQGMENDTIRDRWIQNAEKGILPDVWEEILLSWQSAEGCDEKANIQVSDFRPRLQIAGKTVLINNENYSRALTRFLGSPGQPDSEANGVYERWKFVNRYARVFASHWGGGWHITSFPRAYSIFFDEKMEYARVRFRLGYEGGVTYLKRTEDGWEIVESGLTWIE